VDPDPEWVAHFQPDIFFTNPVWLSQKGIIPSKKLFEDFNMPLAGSEAAATV
jgi:hypothetical protein